MRKEREEAERLRKEEEEKRALAAADERAIQESNDLVEKHCVVKNGTIEKCNYTGPALKKFIIPSHIHSIGERAFENCKIADHIVFHGGIKSMGQFAFAKTPVSKVTLLEGIKTIDSFAFYSCERLSQVELPNSLTKIDGYAFQYCKFNEIKLPENLFEIGCNAFQYTGLVRLHIPKKVKNIAPGFCTAYGLKEITVEQGNAYYTSIDGNLYDRLATTFHTLGRCAEPYSLTIPSSVQTIASHACSCSKKLTSVFIPQSVKRIDSMAFYRCESLTEVFIPKSVEFIGYSTFGVTRAKLKCEVKKPFLSLPQGWNKNWRDNASSVSWSCTR